MLENYTGPEIERWLHLRAIEWVGWPSFVTQPVVPVLIVFFPWYWVIAGLFALNVLWFVVRYSFISPRLAQLAVYFVILKWPATLASAVYLFIHRSYPSGVLALLWPFLSGLVGVPGRVGDVSVVLAHRVGYIDHTDNVIR